jgi:hypothetical protein
VNWALFTGIWLLSQVKTIGGSQSQTLKAITRFRGVSNKALLELLELHYRSPTIWRGAVPGDANVCLPVRVSTPIEQLGQAFSGYCNCSIAAWTVTCCSRAVNRNFDCSKRRFQRFYRTTFAASRICSGRARTQRFSVRFAQRTMPEESNRNSPGLAMS